MMKGYYEGNDNDDLNGVYNPLMEPREAGIERRDATSVFELVNYLIGCTSLY